MAAAIVTALLATPAHAHPRLLRSEPGASQRVSGAVALLRLWFSERPELRLTSITLADSGGRLVSLGAVETEPDDRLGVRASVVGSLGPGAYIVTWRTAAADGHPVSGTFTFTVPSSATSDLARVDSADRTGSIDSGTVHRERGTASGLAYTIVRGVTFVCLLIGIGAVVFRIAVLSRARVGTELYAVISERMANVGFAAALILVLATIARLVLQIQVFEVGLGAVSLSATETVTGTRWGAGWMLQIGGAIVAVGAFWLARRSDRAWYVLALTAVALAFAPGLTGHAVVSPRMTAGAVVADAAHVIGAAGWLGSLFVLIAVAIPAATGTGDDERWTTVSSLNHAFSPTALAFASLLVVTGTFAAWLHLGSLSALFTSSYGRTSLLKLAALVPLALTGAYNWRRVRPVLGTSEATARLHRTASIELVVAVVVVCITAVLVATEPPLR